jgi:hypothetical protein
MWINLCWERKRKMPLNPDVIITYDICNNSITEIKTDLATKKYTIRSLSLDLISFSDANMVKSCFNYIFDKAFEIKEAEKNDK